MYKSLILFFLFFFVIGNVLGQVQHFEVGKPMPDFELKNISYYPRKTATLKDFRGKWLMLDFWNKYCGSCIASFPHVNETQKELGDKVQVMMVGIQDPENAIQPMYAKYRELEKLMMPCAFDSSVANKFDIYASPYIILIDDSGIVRCVTYSINKDDLKGFLSGNPPNLPSVYGARTEEVFDYNYTKPFLINKNGGNDTDFLFRSVLAKWDANKNPISLAEVDKYMVELGKFQALGVPLEYLYECAYWGKSGMNEWSTADTIHYGKYYAHPILEVADSTPFKHSYKYNKGLYCYSLCMPRGFCTSESMKACMQRDLQNYFGYEVIIETRMSPYWQLVAEEGAQKKLKTRGGKPSRKDVYRAGIIVKNWPYDAVSKWIKQQIKGYFEDETGIKGNIDMNLVGIPGNMDSFIAVLKTNGLNLIKREKEMKVLVIGDKKIY